MFENILRRGPSKEEKAEAEREEELKASIAEKTAAYNASQERQESTEGIEVETFADVRSALNATEKPVDPKEGLEKKIWSHKNMAMGEGRVIAREQGEAGADLDKPIEPPAEWGSELDDLKNK